jgi:aspartate/methionine/tyrosine aminotransferase
LSDLDAAAAWGRANDVPVFSDECYVEFTWNGPPRTILATGFDGVVAVHSLSKRSNLAGLRVGFYAGDADIVSYLREVRKHTGMLVPGPAQAQGQWRSPTTSTWCCSETATGAGWSGWPPCSRPGSGIDIAMPAGGFYLWFDAVDGWAFTERLAKEAGTLVSPGDFYGGGGTNNVRAAVVQPDDRIELIARRLGVP